MSENKTPREMAEEIADKADYFYDNDFEFDGEEGGFRQTIFRVALAGLEAGAKLRHEQGHNVVIFKEWWASLEGEK
jgi:hypothetical protein